MAERVTDIHVADKTNGQSWAYKVQYGRTHSFEAQFILARLQRAVLCFCLSKSSRVCFSDNRWAPFGGSVLLMARQSAFWRSDSVISVELTALMVIYMQSYDSLGLSAALMLFIRHGVNYCCNCNRISAIAKLTIRPNNDKLHWVTCVY